MGWRLEGWGTGPAKGKGRERWRSSEKIERQ